MIQSYNFPFLSCRPSPALVSWEVGLKRKVTKRLRFDKFAYLGVGISTFIAHDFGAVDVSQVSG